MKKFFTKDLRGMICIALVIGVWRLFFGQRMPHLGTLGDEMYYMAITAKLKYFLFESGLNEYRLQRIIPCVLVHYTLKLFGLPYDATTMGNAFAAYDCLLYGVVAWVWGLIANELKLGVKGRWLGFLAIFGNYHLLKYIPFMPISTDLFAYTITLSLLYFYLRNNWIGLSLLTLIGAFVWPTVIYMGSAFLMFPREKEENASYSPAPLKLNYVIPIIALIPLTKYLWTVIQLIFSGQMYSYGIFSMGSNKPLTQVIYFSSAIMLAYLVYALSNLLDHRKWFQWVYWKEQIKWPRILLAVGLLIAVKTLIYFGASAQNARPIMYLIANLLIVSTMQPGVFLMSHILYFGPMIILLMFLWKPISRIIQQYGVGLLIASVLVVLFSLDSESRKQMSTYPIILPFLIKAVEDLKWKKVRYVVFIGLALFISKVWYRIDTEGWTSSAIQFPAQSYYMTMGPWMSHDMYFVQGGCVLLSILIIYFLMFFPIKKEGIR